MKTAKSLLGLSCTLGIATAVHDAHAQEVEVPILVLEQAETDVGEEDDELDIANVVQSAAKTVTTIQEAPAIVTVITEDDIKSRGFREFTELVESAPGFLKIGSFHNEFPYIMVRGHVQGILYLVNGLSLFDESFNISAHTRVVPLEKIKRVEVVTGPGGVLWGANSFLGIVNVITKTADDIDGWEVGIGGGDGAGMRQALRGYVMTGQPDLFGGRVKLFAHASFDLYKGPDISMPYFMYHSPQPQPNSLFIYGPQVESSTPHNLVFNFDGQITAGDFTLHWQYPISEEYRPFGIAGAPILENLPEDELPECMYEPIADDGSNRGDLAAGDDLCVDRGRAARKNQWHWVDRFVMLEWRNRFLNNRAGAQVKAFASHMVRSWTPHVIFPPVETLIEGGVGFSTNMDVYRVGTNVDFDFELTDSMRLLVGGEANYAILPDRTTGSVQGPGVESFFEGPYNLDRLPLACPHDATWDAGTMAPTGVKNREGCPVTFAFETARAAFGGFASLQWRPVKGLILDGGVRLQAAPESLSKRAAYDPQLTTAGAIVYEFAKDWHLKLNYTEGFRPAVFNTVGANPESVQVGGGVDLENESSQSIQGEVNARLLKGVRRIRELDFRVDYSYTVLKNFISFPQGSYVNGGDRGIHSVEFLSKLFLRGDHHLEIGYTWLKINTTDLGMYRTTPEHWFQVNSVNTLMPERLQSTIGLKVYGASEDANRRVDVRHLEPWNVMDPVLSVSDPAETVFVNSYEMVIDRVSASAELHLGLRYAATEKLGLAADLHNTFNSRHFQPESFHGLSPRLDLSPFPYELFSFFLTATYQL